MNNQNKNYDKIIIWDNNICLEKWKAFIEDMLLPDYEKHSGHKYEGSIEDFIKQYPIKCEKEISHLNDRYLSDERANLNVQTKGYVVKISVRDNFGINVTDVVSTREHNLRCVLPKYDEDENKPYDYENIKGTFFVEKNCGVLEVHGVEQNEEGKAEYLFRQMRPEYDDHEGIAKLKLEIRKGTMTTAELNEYTLPLGDMVQQVYGFDKDILNERPAFFSNNDRPVFLLNNDYHFKENDLVVCHHKSGIVDDFTIFAVVKTVDRENDILLLEKYQKFGNLKCEEQVHTLSKMEREGYYCPMNDDEKNMFLTNTGINLENTAFNKDMTELGEHE